MSRDPADVSAEMTDGFHLVVDALKLNGVDTIFGVAGIPITDLLRLAQQEGIRYYRLPARAVGRQRRRNRRVFDAKARHLHDRLGAGFLNGLVALANATTNCFPMVLISGSSDRAIVDLEQGDYEEMDQLPPPGPTPRRPIASTGRRISASASRARSAPRSRKDRAASIST